MQDRQELNVDSIKVQTYKLWEKYVKCIFTVCLFLRLIPERQFMLINDQVIINTGTKK